MTEPRVIAEVRSADGWAGLVEAFRLAVELRNTTYEATGELAGLAPRYANKLLAPVPVREIGRISLGPLMGALGVKLLLVEDDEIYATIAGRIKARKPGPKRNTSKGIRQKKRHKWRRFLNDPIGRQIIHSRRMLLTTPAQRSRWAKRAIKARWSKPRLVEIEGAEALAIRKKLEKERS